MAILNTARTKQLLKTTGMMALFVMLLAGIVIYIERYSSWDLQALKTSPDGAFTVYYYRYMSDSDRHAPYGSYLFIQPSGSSTYPPDGYKVFAGYCKKPLRFGWNNDKLLTIHCQHDSQRKIRTLSQKAYGIKIQLHNEPEQNQNNTVTE